MPASTIQDIPDSDIEYKKKMENKYLQIEDALDNIKTTWFDCEIFREYFVNDKSYRQIEADYGIDHVLAWVSVKRTKNKIKEYLKIKTK
jgi:hypothetical protein